MKRVSLYKVLKQFKSYEDKNDFYKENEYWYRGHKLFAIDVAKRKIEFHYGITYYYTHDDYHTTFFTIKEDKE